MRRLLITGAAGGLGSMCRKRLTHVADTLRVSDIEDLGPASSGEECIICDLAERQAVETLVDGCDGILHFGGRSKEDRWEVIRSANIDGVFNLYEAARRCGKPRIVFASSNHAIGYYRQNERIDATAVPRPDSLYGVSKVFGEALASMYHDKFGIETACVRIGSCLSEPTDHRMLSTWLSYADFISLIERVFSIPVLGCPIIYGLSDNDAGWWDNSRVAYLGWRPRDNAEAHRERLDAQTDPPPASAAEANFHGGRFVAEGIHED